MNCAEANRLDIVDYLIFIGYQPQKIRGHNYWYLSPLRNENHASFKVDINKNVWYDHGIGKGGTLIDFLTEFYKSSVSEVLQKLSFFNRQEIKHPSISIPRVHLHENSLLNNKDESVTCIRILSTKEVIEDPLLCQYLKQRNISKSIADIWCNEVHFTMNEKEKIYRALGFKNNAGGYELRNEYFKGSSSPKYITYLDHKPESIAVFEGFFDFLSYQFIHQNQNDITTNFLVLNSLSFFERSLLLIEKHKRIHLYLDNDNAGKKWLELL